MIREHTFKKALCDLGANINLMPLSMVKKLNQGEPTPIALSLQMVDRSLTYPQGIIEDVLVKVDKFIFPIDFVVLDMEEDKEAPLILGRPFLATEQALIDVKDGELTLRVGDDQVKFNLYQSLKFFGDDKAICTRIDSLIPSRDGLMHEYTNRDPLEETILTLKECEKAVVVEEKPITPDGLVLKELLTHLRYAFLGENSTKLVIISVALKDEMEKEILLVFKRNIGAFEWCIDDIKGISPSVCMHKILKEDDAKPIVEHQWRLNPTMK